MARAKSGGKPAGRGRAGGKRTKPAAKTTAGATEPIDASAGPMPESASGGGGPAGVTTAGPASAAGEPMLESGEPMLASEKPAEIDGGAECQECGGPAAGRETAGGGPSGDGDGDGGLRIDLSFDDTNANKHDKRSLEAVRLSVESLGAGRSIVVDKTGRVIGGEATLRAAQELGLRLRPVRTSGDELVVVVRDDLEPGDPRRTALAIADNQTAKLSAFDPDVLGEQMQALADQAPLLAAATGFSEKQVRIMTGVDVASGSDAVPENIPDGHYVEQYGVTVMCENEAHQKSVYDLLTEMGYNCRVVVT